MEWDKPLGEVGRMSPPDLRGERIAARSPGWTLSCGSHAVQLAGALRGQGRSGPGEGQRRRPRFLSGPEGCGR